MSSTPLESRVVDAIDAFGADVTASADAWATIQRRARPTRRWSSRRIGLGLGALGLLAGLGVPIEQALTPASHDDTGVKTVEPNPTPRKVDNPAPTDDGERVASAVPDGASTAPVSSAPPAKSRPAPVAPTTPTTSASRYPSAASCSLSSVGLAPGQTRRCHFTATASGGWRYDSAGGAGFDIPSATVTVTRSGMTKTYKTSGEYGCADAIIAPGDMVEVTLTAPVTDVAPGYQVGAGRNWDCSHTG